MSFNLQDFVKSPSFDKVNECRREDLLVIAAHFKICVRKSGSKEVIKNKLLEGLMDLKVMSVPSQSMAGPAANDVPSTAAGVSSFPEGTGEGAAPATPLGAQPRSQGPPATLPRSHLSLVGLVGPVRMPS